MGEMTLEKQIKFIFERYLNFEITSNQFAREISHLTTLGNLKVQKEILKQITHDELAPGILLFLCRNVFGRSEIFEEKLSLDPHALAEYAKQVIKNRLPEELHNKMLAFYIEHPNNEIIKNYFLLIKNQVEII